jgi:hypothetical protein
LARFRRCRRVARPSLEYAPRDPGGVLHRIVRDHVETFRSHLAVAEPDRLVLYHGVLAPRAAVARDVVPGTVALLSGKESSAQADPLGRSTTMRIPTDQPADRLRSRTVRRGAVDVRWPRSLRVCGRTND